MEEEALQLFFAGLKGQWVSAVLPLLYIIVKRWEKYREAAAESDRQQLDLARDRARRSMERSISEQVDHIYSTGYEAMSGRVYDLHHAGRQHITYQMESGEFQKSLSGFLVEYKKELKNVCFKKLHPTITDHIKDDTPHYTGNDWVQYTEDTAADIRSVLKRSLGKRLGTSDLLHEVFEDVLTYELFLVAYRKLVNRARDNKGRL